MAKLLVVDDEADIRSAFGKYLERLGHDVLYAASGNEAIAQIKAERPAVVLLDLFLPDRSGFEVLDSTRDERPVIIIITGHGDIPAAVHAMQNGAEAFLTKPIELTHLGAVVEKALEKSHLRELRNAADARIGRAAADMLLGSSGPMRDLAAQIEMLARSERTVALIVGENGVGKARVARAIHALSARAAYPFFDVSCSLRPVSALSGELFGVDRGDGRPLPGIFESADGGTVFIDEIAELPDVLQPALLQVLRTHRVRRDGGSRDIPINVRVIAATVRDLATEVTEHRFREDLYYALGVMPLHLPPLRARAPEDLLETTRALLADLRRGLLDAPTEITDEALQAISQYPWPGNVRELRNTLERALILSQGQPRVEVTHLAPEVRGIGDDASLPHVARTLAEVEQVQVYRTLRAHQGNRTKAARELGISRATLIKKVREYGVEEGSNAPRMSGEFEL